MEVRMFEPGCRELPNLDFGHTCPYWLVGEWSVLRASVFHDTREGWGVSRAPQRRTVLVFKYIMRLILRSLLTGLYWLGHAS